MTPNGGGRRESRRAGILEATGENTKSGALDAAAEFYLSMAAVDAGRRVGALAELLEAAEGRGALAGPEIAAVLDCEEVPVGFSSSWQIG